MCGFYKNSMDCFVFPDAHKHCSNEEDEISIIQWTEGLQYCQLLQHARAYT